jgi:hypothetical protein
MSYCFFFSLLSAVCVRPAARLRNRFHPDLHGYKQWISRQAFRQVTSMDMSFPFSSSKWMAAPTTAGITSSIQAT